jgi:uncharacterized membrane protein
MMDMAQIEGEHRRKLESEAQGANIEAMRRQFSEAKLGQIFALVIALTFLGVGAYVSVHGQPWSGTILGGIGVSGIVTAFIVGRGRETQPQETTTAPPDQSPSST